MKVYTTGAMQDYKTGIKLMMRGDHHFAVVHLPDGARADRPAADPSGKYPRHDDDAVRGREPARVHVARHAAGRRAACRRPPSGSLRHDGGHHRRRSIA